MKERYHLKLTLLLICILSVIMAISQPILTQVEKPKFISELTSQGALSHQFSCFIVGEKPLALRNLAFWVKNEGEKQTLSVSIYKGSINGTTATLYNNIASTTANVEATGEFKRTEANFSADVALEPWGVYYVVLHNQSSIPAKLIIGVSASIGSLKANGITTMSGVFNQDIPVTGSVKGLVDKNGYIGMDMNGPANITLVPERPTIDEITGSAQRGKNTINWKISKEELVRSCVLERSVNGAVFSTVATEIDESYIDKNVVNGSITYRLKMTALNGEVQYSSPVVLQSKAYDLTAKLLQNQFRRGETVNIAVNADQATRTSLTIMDRFGRPVKQIEQTLTAGLTNIRFSSSELSLGMYYVKFNNVPPSANDIKLVVL